MSHYIVSFAVSGGCVGIVISLAYEEMFVRLTAQEVDIRVVGLLIGEEHGVESCLAEGSEYSLFAIQAVVIVGCCGGQQHRYALVCGVRLRAHVAEHEQS